MSGLWCDICKGFKLELFGSHKCPPQWSVMAPEYEDADDAPYTCYAYDAEEAARKWAEAFDWDSGEGVIIHRGTVECVVWRASDEDSKKTYVVTGEMVPEYRAREKKA